MHILVHTFFDDGPFREYPALLFDWDRIGAAEDTTGSITAVLSLPSGTGPTLRFVSNLEHVSRRHSAHHWRRLTEALPG